MYCLQFTIHGSLKFVFGQLFMRDRDDTLILINGISRIALIFDQMDGIVWYGLWSIERPKLMLNMFKLFLKID